MNYVTKIKGIKYIFAGFLILLLPLSLSAFDINPDGSFKIKPYSDKQKFDLEVLSKDIDEFQQKITELMPYIKKENKIINNQYLKQTAATTVTTVPYKFQFIVNENFIIFLDSIDTQDQNKPYKLSGITFQRRKSRTNKLLEELTTFEELKNATANQRGIDGIELYVKTILPSGPIDKKYKLSSIVNPKDRVKLVRNYRNFLEIALRQIDKVIASDAQQQMMDVSKTLDNLSSTDKD